MNENRLDILLNRDGDVIFSENGDVTLTDGIRQAA
jgi:hypothetical protein